MKLLRSARRFFAGHNHKVAVRAHIPWYWRWLGVFAIVAVTAVVIRWVIESSHRADLAQHAAMTTEISRLRTENSDLSAESARLKAALADRDRQARIDQAAQTNLTRSLAQLQDEGERLKEELTFLRTIMAAGSGPEGVNVSNFKIEPSGIPNEYRYRLMLSQGGTREQDFLGHAQFVVNLVQGSKSFVLAVPEENPGKPPAMDIRFKYYQKLEGTFRVPAGAVVKRLEVRIYEQGNPQPKVSRTISPS